MIMRMLSTAPLSAALFAAAFSAGVGAQTAETPEVTLSAESANVAEPGHPVRIRIFRWSSDRERTPILVALDPLPPPVATAEERGGAARGRAAAGGARGRGRGGRGGAAAAPLTPEAALAGAIRRAPSIGYIWTNDVTGYSIKFAHRMPLPDGGERIVLATDRRLGTHSAAWQPVTSAAQTDYPFTVLELRFDAKGNGEARTSLTTKVVVDKTGGTLALENYTAAPAILQKVRRAAISSEKPPAS
jgi:hypothetical protein